jgi:molybdopterin-guanine dinucleotide biosynthesis protein MobB
MNRIHIVGRKNHGKTELIVDLLKELSSRGLRVATIKHTHHRHELDVPGKDSYRHRQAGAAAVGVLSGDVSALFLPVPQGMSAADCYELFAPVFRDCDLVLVEGDSQAAAPRLEVWRAALGTAPLAEEDPRILGLVTDDPTHVAARILARSNLPAVADWVLSMLPT